MFGTGGCANNILVGAIPHSTIRVTSTTTTTTTNGSAKQVVLIDVVRDDPGAGTNVAAVAVAVAVAVSRDGGDGRGREVWWERRRRFGRRPVVTLHGQRRIQVGRSLCVVR